MKTFAKATTLLLAMICASLLATAQTRADAEKDLILKAMLTELDRSAAKLKLENFPTPFFIQYTLDDSEQYDATAQYGALIYDAPNHERRIHVVIRVGNTKTDSSSPNGDGYVTTVAIEDDPVAIRTALWWASDNAYKHALREYSRKLSVLKQLQTPPQADDFSVEKPLIHLEEVKHLSYDRTFWTAEVTRLSGLYRTAPILTAAARAGVSIVDTRSIQHSSAQFSARASTRYIVNSEGTIVRKSLTEYREGANVDGQASDGMEISRYISTNGATVAELESTDVFGKRAWVSLIQFNTLLSAPIVTEEYHGPVLFTGEASASVLGALFVPGILASRPEPGTEVRTNGPYASSLHTRVMPLGFDVVDDPLQTSYKGKSLLGAYAVDDEGVAAQSVKLVTAGKLEGYLMDRQPIRDFPASNGHGRASQSGSPRTSLGVLRISPREGISKAELETRLKKAIEDNGLDHGYIVEGSGNNLAPELLYRVDAKGNKTLVRGAALDDLDQRALRSGILAAGSELTVNNETGDVPTTMLTPELLFGDVTVKRAADRNNKLPYYPSPIEESLATK
jgi:hypothetical protein